MREHRLNIGTPNECPDSPKSQKTTKLPFAVRLPEVDLAQGLTLGDLEGAQQRVAYPGVGQAGEEEGSSREKVKLSKDEKKAPSTYALVEDLSIRKSIGVCQILNFAHRVWARLVG